MIFIGSRIYVGLDLQHIRKDCYGCDGKGRTQQTLSTFGEPWVANMKFCPRCGGSGIYEQFWVNLKRYKLGNREFHSPLQKFYSRENVGISHLAEIEGYITHVAPRFYLYAESAYWLMLIFNPSLFFQKIGKTGYPSWKFTPMVIISTLIFDVSHIPGSIKRRWNRLASFFLHIKQTHCSHDFGIGGELWKCSKCEAPNPECEVPF